MTHFARLINSGLNARTRETCLNLLLKMKPESTVENTKPANKPANKSQQYMATILVSVINYWYDV